MWIEVPFIEEASNILICCRASHGKIGDAYVCVCVVFLFFIKSLGFSDRASTLVIWSCPQSSTYRHKVGLSFQPFNTINMHLCQLNSCLSWTSYYGAGLVMTWYLPKCSRSLTNWVLVELHHYLQILDFWARCFVFSFCVDPPIYMTGPGSSRCYGDPAGIWAVTACLPVPSPPQSLSRHCIPAWYPVKWRAVHQAQCSGLSFQHLV